MLKDKEVRKLIIPLIFEQLLAVSIGFIDTLMVSTVGETAVSGVALVDNINRLIIQVMSAFAAGGIVIASQYYGSGNVEKTRKTCAQLESLMLIFSVITALICALFSRNILGAVFGAVEYDVMQAANTYLVVTAVSYPFFGVYTAGTAILRSLGDTKTSMIVSLIMNVINVLLNALFVFKFNMGVFGVAAATLIGRIAAGLIIKYIISSKRNPLKVTDLKFYIPALSYVKKILKIGIPSGIENGMFQIGKLVVVTMVAALGTDAIAANAVAYQIIDFPNIPASAIGLALVVIVGRDIGANDNEAAIKDTKRMLLFAYAGDWICKIALFAAAPVIVSAFSLSASASYMAVTVLRYFSAASLPVWPMSFTMPNALRGAGDAKYTMIVSVASMWLCRVIMCYILLNVLNMGILGVWIGMFADWYMRGIFYFARFKSRKWLNKGVI